MLGLKETKDVFDQRKKTTLPILKGKNALA
jgi:hypothetical protein